MNNNNDYNLFNASDNTLMPYLKQEDFEKSLLFNVLFQDKLLIHESNYFTSQFLANHIKNSKASISLFEAAAIEGLIIPAFRNEKVNTLRESYDIMQQTYGSDYILTNETHNISSLSRMCDSTDLGRKKQKAFYWPKNIILGEGYHNTIKAFLQKEELPLYIHENTTRYSRLKKYWELTKNWRYDLIENAAEQTLIKGNKGLQRTELIKLLAKVNGLPESIALDAKNPISKYIKDIQQRKTVDIFLKWITQCYQLNMARAFDSSLNFPIYNTNEDFMCESIARVPIDKSIVNNDGFDCVVKLPPMEVLLTENPSNLISIRNELGYSYLIALKDWQEMPVNKNMDKVQKLFQDYCDRICEYYSTRKVEVKSNYSSGKIIVREGFDLISNILSALFPPAGVFMAMRKFGHAIYEYKADIEEKKLSKNKLEINLRESTKLNI